MKSHWQADANLTLQHTLRLKSCAKQFVELHEIAELAGILEKARGQKLQVLPLGEGSNVVLGPRIDALVIKIATSGYSVLNEDENTVTVRVAAGENWHRFVKTCVTQGWHGLENLALIPGTVGAAPMQNIGAYGVEVARFIKQVHFFNLRGDKPLCAGARRGDHGEYSLAGSACEFAYRDSIFKRALRDKVLITSVTFQLDKHFMPQLDYPALKAHLGHTAGPGVGANELVDAVIAIRRAKLPDPSQVANAGSFFKNPVVNRAAFEKFIKAHPQAPYFITDIVGRYQNVDQENLEGKSNSKKDASSASLQGYKIPAGWLIEQCGFKGRHCGSLGMHTQQALVLINRAPGEVEASEVIAYAKKVCQAVREQFGLELEIEPRCYGC